MKRKLLRANHASYISKPLRKVIMRTSHLEKVYHKNKSEKSFKAYKKQKNICSRLYKKERKRFFNNLNPSFGTDNKLFWKTIKPFFSNKVNYGSRIKLIEKDEVLQDDNLIAKELNKFFKNAVSTLNIKENRFITNRSSDYRPISILPVASKIFERIMQKQINDFIISFLSPYLYGYRKGFNTQHALLTLVENWRKSLNNKGFGGAI